MKKLVVLILAGLSLAACAEAPCGSGVWTSDGWVCSGPGRG